MKNDTSLVKKVEEAITDSRLLEKINDENISSAESLAERFRDVKVKPFYIPSERFSPLPALED